MLLGASAEYRHRAALISTETRAHTGRNDGSTLPVHASRMSPVTGDDEPGLNSRALQPKSAPRRPFTQAMRGAQELGVAPERRLAAQISTVQCKRTER
jgi:hypothetical protein